MKKYDVIVIGMGPAGMAVANIAHVAGMSVLTVEKNKVGGECLNCGCIPSKAILKVAQIKNDIKNLEKFGLELSGDVKVTNALELIRQKIGTIGRVKATKMFENVDSIVSQGEATFVDEHTIRVKDDLYRGKFIFIATGSEPSMPNIKGLSEIDYLTNKNLFKVENIPESLVVVGGGAIACEMGQAFRRLGAKVSLINMDDHIIPSIDEDVVSVLEEKLRNEGVDIFNGTTVDEFRKTLDKIEVNFSGKKLVCDRVLIAAGRKPAIDKLGLDRIGIKYTKYGIDVDEFNRTNIKHIYAVGDCNGKNLFSHAAMHQGMLSAMHMIKSASPCSLKRSGYVVPFSIFTDPEIAHVGMTEKEARENGIEFTTIKEYYRDYGRVLIDGKDDGFIKIVATPKGSILGVSIVGDAASELITEWAMALQFNITLDEVAMMQHPFPAVSLLNMRAAQKFMMGEFLKHTQKRGIGRPEIA